MGKFFQYQKLTNENYLDTTVIGGFMRNLLHKKSIKNDVIPTTTTTTAAAAVTAQNKIGYKNYCNHKEEITNSYIATGTDVISPPLPAPKPPPPPLLSTSLSSAALSTSPTSTATTKLSSSIVRNSSLITDINTNAIRNTTSKNYYSFYKSSNSNSCYNSSYNIKKKFSKNKKYNETECNPIHKYQEEEYYASKYYNFKKNVKKDNNPTTTSIISSSSSSSSNSSSNNRTNSDIITNNKENNHKIHNINSFHYKNSTFDKSTQTTTATSTSIPIQSSASSSTLLLLSQAQPTIRIPTAPPIESSESKIQSTKENFKFSNHRSNHKQSRYHFHRQIGYYYSNRQKKENLCSIKNTINTTADTDSNNYSTSNNNSLESYNLTSTTFYPSPNIRNTSKIPLLPSAQANSTTTSEYKKSQAKENIIIASKRNQKNQEVPLSSSLYYHYKRQSENENIIRQQQKQHKQQLPQELYYKDEEGIQQHQQQQQQHHQTKTTTTTTTNRSQLQPCHRIFYEEKSKGQQNDEKYRQDDHKQNQQQQQQQPIEPNNIHNNTETRIFIVNEKFNEYNKEATTPSSFVGTLPKKKTKSKIYGFMKDFLKKKFCNNTNSLNLNKEEDIYVELPNNIKVLSSNFVNNSNCSNKNNNNNNSIRYKSTYNNKINSRFDVMQDVRLRFELQPTSTSSTQQQAQTATTTQSTTAVAVAAATAAAVAAQQQQLQQQHSLVHQLQINHHGSPNRLQNCRPIHLFQTHTTNLCSNTNSDSSSAGDGDNAGQQSPQSPSSEEDNSPTEMNNCRRLGDKPPLVKRLTMGFLKSTEDSRPLVHIHSTSGTNCTPSRTASDGYVNEAICEPDKIISSKFGDSCRQSLTALPMLDSRHYHDNHSEFNFKKKYLRETSSANSSPKMYAPSTVPLRMDTLSLAEQNELRGAPWFQAGIPREISLEVLSKQNPGAFLVRQSSTKPGCFALSLRCPPPAAKVAHYLILRTPRGYKIKGFTKEFSSLRALITHHSVMPELLPIPLSLPRPHHNFLSSRRHCDDFDTYDSLDDLRKQMSEI